MTQPEHSPADMRDLLNLLSYTQMSVFISGPIPTLDRARVNLAPSSPSRPGLSQPAAIITLILLTFFYLFWCCPALFEMDGFHSNMLGWQLSSVYLQHLVQISTRDWLFTHCSPPPPSSSPTSLPPTVTWTCPHSPITPLPVQTVITNRPLFPCGNIGLPVIISFRLNHSHLLIQPPRTQIKPVMWPS